MKNESKAFSRKELQEIGKRAEELAQGEGNNYIWQKAYEELAMAIDRLDAMIARAFVRDNKDW